MEDCYVKLAEEIGFTVTQVPDKRINLGPSPAAIRACLEFGEKLRRGKYMGAPSNLDAELGFKPFFAPNSAIIDEASNLYDQESRALVELFGEAGRAWIDDCVNGRKPSHTSVSDGDYKTYISMLEHRLGFLLQ
jgi:hypothetical protein